MVKFRFQNGISAAFCAVILSCMVGLAHADKITLESGEIVYGSVINAADPMTVKTEAGDLRKIPKKDVKEIKKGVTSKTGAAPTAPAAKNPAAKTPATTDEGAAAPDDAPPVVKPTSKGPMTFGAAQTRASSVTSPMAAVAIWQEYIDSKPTGDDLKNAKVEMAKWQKMADEGSEKIKGKWVGGAERKAILEKADKLSREGSELMDTQTLQAVAKLQEANEIYPNSFRSNFLLGYLMLLQHKAPEATKYLEQALKIQPDSPEALANLSLLAIDKKQYAKALQMLYKAAQGHDTKPIAMNLCTAVSLSPKNILTSKASKPAVDAARLLSVKYGIQLPSHGLVVVPLSREDGKPGGGPELAGAMWSGTGFVISDEGLILTNRHVADNAKTLLVMLADGTKKSAKVIMIDDEQDLALIKVDPDGKKLPMVTFASKDNPGDGAECTVMGFPLLDRLGGSIKVTRGIVSSGKATDATLGPDVLIDAKVNPGNSGGPILDKHGNVMAIVSMKSLSNAMEDSYGMGISAGKIRKFLDKNKVVPGKVDEAGAVMSAEDIAAKVKPATVCILATR